MFGNSYFYNSTTRKYVALFGTLFNDIIISRKDNSDVEQKRFKVPIAYGPVQKFLARIGEDPNLDRPAITLPRMSFEITSMFYDGQRKLTRRKRNSQAVTTNDNTFRTQFVPAPYNIEFTLSIMAKYSEDGTKVLEQILPFFKPDWVSSVQLTEDMDDLVDVPLVLNSVDFDDTYDSNFEERRVLIWTLNFTMKAYYFGPTTEKKVIKFAETDVFTSLSANDHLETVKVQPGLTANGEPTTDINETVPYQDINAEDDWGFIVTIEDAP